MVASKTLLRRAALYTPPAFSKTGLASIWVSLSIFTACFLGLPSSSPLAALPAAVTILWVAAATDGCPCTGTPLVFSGVRFNPMISFEACYSRPFLGLVSRRGSFLTQMFLNATGLRLWTGDGEKW